MQTHIPDNLTCADLQQIGGKPLLLEIPENPTSATDWAQQNAGRIKSLLDSNGALLIRGLDIQGSKKFGKVTENIFQSPLLSYQYRSTPRSRMRGNVYTASEYHAHETILQHNESAYSTNWPSHLGFCCMQTPDTKGATPITDSHAVYNAIDPEVRDLFESKGLMYVRNYLDVDLPWQEVFQTQDKAEVEQFCLQQNMKFEWLSDDHLRTSQVAQVSLAHPITNQTVWFNQAHLFHLSALSQENQSHFLSVFGEAGLPRNVYFADGSPIENALLDHIRDIYQRLQIRFDWQKSDLLLVDNLAYTHGREPFTGNRKVLVSMVSL
ncbi:taurine catabolism dioxygenase TauD [Pseudoalteromonas luteoviolacea]|uniref:Taurine catabolism dioxygenase TauD n=1 Tax=Pseudoalteromonas luteoviolacea TaxID=43657 RepID=A0A1C0TJT5_9GAMM|nr:TauD/TfdA family dioxygenase [Pseudoalteromonas luteoviolacea]OCQ18692.1 taurine catabolism dioxygenase TauD [Pseudoalteromonas luteoviolacea]